MSRRGPLDGVSVVAFDAIGPVPLATSMLADMGASILTIERPREGAALPAGLGSTSPINRDLKVGIDLKRPAGVETALRLLAQADVLIEGFRPGVLERLGLGPEIVAAKNHRIIYTRVTGWGQEGDYASMAGHDINYLGLTGALAAIGGPKRPIPPLNLVADYGGGTMFAISGILAALVERGITGDGQVVDVSMVDGASTLFGPIRSLAHAGVWHDRRQANLLDGGAPFYRTYRTADDRFVAVGALEPAFYEAFVAGLGLEIAELPNRFDPENWADLADRFALIFATRTRDAWQEVFDDTDACVTPVLDMHEVMDHHHNAARSVLIESQHGPRPAPAPRFTRFDGSSYLRPQSVVDADESSTLAAWGFSSDEVDSLRAAGIIAEP